MPVQASVPSNSPSIVPSPQYSKEHQPIPAVPTLSPVIFASTFHSPPIPDPLPKYIPLPSSVLKTPNSDITATDDKLKGIISDTLNLKSSAEPAKPEKKTAAAAAPIFPKQMKSEDEPPLFSETYTGPFEMFRTFTGKVVTAALFGTLGGIALIRQLFNKSISGNKPKDSRLDSNDPLKTSIREIYPDLRFCQSAAPVAPLCEANVEMSMTTLLPDSLRWLTNNGSINPNPSQASRLPSLIGSYSSGFAGSTYLNQNGKTKEIIHVLDSFLATHTNVSGNVMATAAIADGFGGHRDLENDTAIAFVSQQACRLLCQAMMKYNTPESLEQNHQSIIASIHQHLNNLTKRGATNVSGVRVFPLEGNRVKIVGISLSNNRWFVTDAETGKTYQLNNLHGVNDSDPQISINDGKGSIGNDEEYHSAEVECFTREISDIHPKNFIIWGATDGAWQWFDKSINPFLIDCDALQKVLKECKNSRKLQEALKDYILNKFYFISRELPHYSVIISNLEKDKAAFFSNFHKALKLNLEEKEELNRLVGAYRQARDAKRLYEDKFARTRVSYDQIKAYNQPEHQELWDNYQNALTMLKRASTEIDNALWSVKLAAKAKIAAKEVMKRSLPELKILLSELKNEINFHRNSEKLLTEHVNNLETLINLYKTSGWRPDIGKALDDAALVALSPFRQNNLDMQEFSYRELANVLENEVNLLNQEYKKYRQFYTINQEKRIPPFRIAVGEYVATLLKSAETFNKVYDAIRHHEKFNLDALIEEYQEHYKEAEKKEEAFKEIRSALSENGMDFEIWNGIFETQKEAYLHLYKSAIWGLKRFKVDSELSKSEQVLNGINYVKEFLNPLFNKPTDLDETMKKIEQEMWVPSQLYHELEKYSLTKVIPEKECSAPLIENHSKNQEVESLPLLIERLKELQRIRDVFLEGCNCGNKFLNDAEEAENLAILSIQITKLAECIEYRTKLIDLRNQMKQENSPIDDVSSPALKVATSLIAFNQDDEKFPVTKQISSNPAQRQDGTNSFPKTTLHSSSFLVTEKPL